MKAGQVVPCGDDEASGVDGVCEDVGGGGAIACSFCRCGDGGDGRVLCLAAGGGGTTLTSHHAKPPKPTGHLKFHSHHFGLIHPGCLTDRLMHRHSALGPWHSKTTVYLRIHVGVVVYY